MGETSVGAGGGGDKDRPLVEELGGEGGERSLGRIGKNGQRDPRGEQGGSPVAHGEPRHRHSYRAAPRVSPVAKPLNF